MCTCVRAFAKDILWIYIYIEEKIVAQKTTKRAKSSLLLLLLLLLTIFDLNYVKFIGTCARARERKRVVQWMHKCILYIYTLRKWWCVQCLCTGSRLAKQQTQQQQQKLLYRINAVKWIAVPHSPADKINNQ